MTKFDGLARKEIPAAMGLADLAETLETSTAARVVKMAEGRSRENLLVLVNRRKSLWLKCLWKTVRRQAAGTDFASYVSCSIQDKVSDNR